MLLGGLQKTTLIDYPGKIACTVFTVGCNFRCPFCHNKDLVTKQLFQHSGVKPLSQKDFFDFLEERKKILDGVCITGGEPTINTDLPVFISKIKKLGYVVKLDTNGSNSEMIRKLINRGLIDYIAMDIKSTFDEYQKLIKVKSQIRQLADKSSTRNSKFLNKIKQSIKIILKSNLPHEFRTTVVPTIHDKESLVKLAKQLKPLNTKYQILNTRLNWYLQSFRPQNCLDEEFLKIEPYTEKEMKELLAAIQKIFPQAQLRGF
jgi:pyruvate formate lyase activating enzyme